MLYFVLLIPNTSSNTRLQRCFEAVIHGATRERERERKREREREGGGGWHERRTRESDGRQISPRLLNCDQQTVQSVKGDAGSKFEMAQKVL